MKTKERVAFQGERGAYSEEAILSFFKSDVIVSPYPTLYDTFEAVLKKFLYLKHLHPRHTNLLLHKLMANLDYIPFQNT